MVPGPDAHTQILDTEEAGGRIIRGSALRTGALAVGIGLSVISTALLTRHLGVVHYGEYLTVISLLFIVAGLSEAGLDNIGVQEYTRLQGEERDRATGNLVGIRLLLAVVGVAIVSLFAHAAYDSTMAVGTLLGGAGVVLFTLTGALSVQLFSSLRLAWVAVAELLRQVLLVATIVGLVLTGAGLLPFLVSAVPAQFAMLILVLMLVRGRIAWRPRADRSEWSRLLRVALPFAVATAAGILYYRVAIILMSLVSTATETGYFGASFRVIEVLVAVPPLLATSAFPLMTRTAKGDQERFSYALGRMFEVSVLVGTGMSVALLVGAPLAIDIIAGPQFANSVDLLRIQSLVLLSTFLIATSAYALLAQRRYSAVMVANGIAVTLVAVLSLSLIPMFDAEGAAIAMVCSEFGLALIYAVYLWRHEHTRPPVRIVPKVVLAAGLALSVLLVPGLPVVAELAIAAVVYLGVAALTRAIPPEIWNALVPWRPDVMEP